MGSIETLTVFLGWCTLINFSVLMLATLFLTGMRGWVVQAHGKMLGLGEEDLLPLYAQYLSSFKIAWVMLNLVPWLALKIMA